MYQNTSKFYCWFIFGLKKAYGIALKKIIKLHPTPNPNPQNQKKKGKKVKENYEQWNKIT